MYQEHVRVISAGMRGDPDVFVRGVAFAILSIRQQFVTVTRALAEVERAGLNARSLWGCKRGAYDFLRKNKISLWNAAVGSERSEDAIEHLCSVPCLGIVKAAFVAQLMGFDIGCLDTRNIQRLGLNPREWRSDGAERKATPAFKRKVGRYVDATAGRAEELWNDWCEDVAGTYKVTAEEISRDHLVIVPPRLRKRFPLDPVPVIGRQQIPFAA